MNTLWPPKHLRLDPPLVGSVSLAPYLPSTWHGAAQHDTIQHGARAIIIQEVRWAFEQNGGGKNPLAAVSILSAGRIRRSSVLDSSSRMVRAV